MYSFLNIWFHFLLLICSIYMLIQLHLIFSLRNHVKMCILLLLRMTPFSKIRKVLSCNWMNKTMGFPNSNLLCLNLHSWGFISIDGLLALLYSFSSFSLHWILNDSKLSFTDCCSNHSIEPLSFFLFS